jgi:hypothetical protein
MTSRGALRLGPGGRGRDDRSCGPGCPGDGFDTLNQAMTISAGVTHARMVLTGSAPRDVATAGTVTFGDVGLFVR